MKAPKVAILLNLLILFFIGYKMNEAPPCFPEQFHGDFSNSSAIIAFELISELAHLESILEPPCKDGTAPIQERIDFLKDIIHWDFPFIIAYSILFLLLAKAYLANSKRIVKQLTFGLIIGIALLDLSENLFGLEVLNTYQEVTESIDNIKWLYASAFAKWVLLFVTILLLTYFALVHLGAIRTIVIVGYLVLLALFLFDLRMPLPYVGNVAGLLTSVNLLLLLGLLVGVFVRKVESEEQQNN